MLARQVVSRNKIAIYSINSVVCDKMPKLKTKAESISDLLAKNIGGGVFRRQADTVFCKVCIKRLNTITKYTLENHIKTQVHENLVKRREQQQRQIDSDGFVLSSETDIGKALSQSTFMHDVTKAFITADIPLNKMNSHALRQLFEKYTKFNLPSESMARQFIMPKIYDQTIESTKQQLAGKKIWVSIDETRDRSGKLVGVVVLRALDRLDRPYLYKVIDLEKTNSETICRTVDDAIRSLGDSTNRDDILMLLTDGAPYMLKAGSYIF